LTYENQISILGICFGNAFGMFAVDNEIEDPREGLDIFVRETLADIEWRKANEPRRAPKSPDFDDFPTI
jgi:hypothetical protein